MPLPLTPTPPPPPPPPPTCFPPRFAQALKLGRLKEAWEWAVQMRSQDCWKQLGTAALEVGCVCGGGWGGQMRSQDCWKQLGTAALEVVCLCVCGGGGEEQADSGRSSALKVGGRGGGGSWARQYLKRMCGGGEGRKRLLGSSIARGGWKWGQC